MAPVGQAQKTETSSGQHHNPTPNLATTFTANTHTGAAVSLDKAGLPSLTATSSTGAHHTMQAGETLFGISKKYNVPLDQLIKANPTLVPERIKPGIEINLPTSHKTSYTIVAGDSLWKIAKANGISVDALQKANPELNPNSLKIGSEISLPVPFTPKETTKPDIGPRKYIIHQGDTFDGLSKVFKVSSQSIQEANPGVDPKKLRPGQYLNIPGEGSVSHQVKDGENLTTIAHAHLLAPESLRKANPSINPDKLSIGQGLNVPNPSEVDAKYIEHLCSYKGVPYGKGPGHFNCVTFLKHIARERGVSLKGGNGHEYLDGQVDTVTKLEKGNMSMNSVRTGDLWFIGHDYQKVAAGFSVLHMGIVGRLQNDAVGRVIDATIFHASTSGSVVESPSLKEYLKNAQNQKRAPGEPPRDKMVIARLKEDEAKPLLGAIPLPVP